eukprot:2596385-Prymnesium_polylepis.2
MTAETHGTNPSRRDRGAGRPAVRGQNARLDDRRNPRDKSEQKGSGSRNTQHEAGDEQRARV